MSSVQRDFARYFSAWAVNYDETVIAPRGILAEVFDGYENTLYEVARRVKKNVRLVVDVGAGTGNLSLACLRLGLPVLGVDPNPDMRARAREKLPDTVEIRAGDFLHLPLVDGGADAVVSTWAFHHVPDRQKPDAAREIARVLSPGGRVVMADTAYESERARDEILTQLAGRGRQDWVDELQAEYYPTLAVVEEAFHQVGFGTSFKRLNRWVWLWEASRTTAISQLIYGERTR